jgi:hypothetical protein
MAQVSLAQGLLDESWRHAGQALSLGLSCDDGRVISQAYRLQAEIYRWLDSNANAIPLFAKAVEVGGETVQGMEALYRMGLALVHSAYTGEGMEALERCIQVCQFKGMGLQLIAAKGALAEALLHLNRDQEAIALAEEVTVQAVHRHIPSLRAVGYLTWGSRALKEGKLEEARQKGMALAHQGRLCQTPLMEIGGYVLAIRAGDRQREARDRLAEIVAEINRNIQEPALRPHADRMMAQYDELIG